MSVSEVYNSGEWEDHTPVKPTIAGQAIISDCCKAQLSTYANPDHLEEGVGFRCLDCGRRWSVQPNEGEGQTWISANREPVLLYGGV